MLLIEITLLLFMNSVFSFTLNLKPDDDDDYRIFWINSHSISYTKISSIDNRVTIKLPLGMRVKAIDYHASKKMLYWTSPPIGYWTENPKLYSMPWDYKMTCDGGKEDPRLCITTSNQIHSGLGNQTFYNRVSEIKVLREERDWNPRSLAVDYIGDKLYIVDTIDRSVSVLDLDGRNRAAIFKNEMLIPMEIVLDPPVGLMFIAAVNMSSNRIQIYRVYMDGTNPKLIVPIADELQHFSMHVNIGLAIDRNDDRVYFSNTKDNIIEYVGYSGGRKRVAVKAENATSISVRNDKIYWMSAVKNMGTNSDVEYVLYNCTLNRRNRAYTQRYDEDDGKYPVYNRKIPIHKVQTMKIIHLYRLPTNSNPCGSNNGDCQHHCLIKFSDESFSVEEEQGFSCICRNGFELYQDSKSCVQAKVTTVSEAAYVPSNFTFRNILEPPVSQLYPISKSLLMRLDRGNYFTVLQSAPFRFFQIALNDANIRLRDLSYEDSISGAARTEEESYVEDTDYYYPNNSSIILRRYNDDAILRVLAYDWITKTLYFAKSTGVDLNSKLMALKFDKPSNVSLHGTEDSEQYGEESEIFLANIKRPSTMVVHPYRGYIFAAIHSSLFETPIMRLNTDGSGKLEFPNVKNANLLAIDFNDDKLYWLDFGFRLNFANFDGSALKRLEKLDNDVFRAFYGASNLLYVHGAWIYFKADEGRIRRFNKMTGKLSGMIQSSYRDGSGKLVTRQPPRDKFLQETIGIAVSARDAQYVDGDAHPCVIENGGCKEFCFGLSVPGANQLKKLCACGGSRKLGKGGLSCGAAAA